ncbi:MAG: ATP-dependent zinc metalloprotease FtsH [Gallicola sp.]|nr:ATP-dependent zinc metalloprotease FtsH [Gallicola sp.]
MKKVLKSLLIYLVPLVIIAYLLTVFNQNVTEVKKVTVDELVQSISNSEIKNLTVQGDKWEGTLKDAENTEFTTYLPRELKEYFYANYLKEPIETGQLKYTEEPVPQTPWYIELLPTLIVFAGLGVLWYVFMSKTQGSNGKVMNFGKSKAKLNKENGVAVTFDDVAGLKEEKEELMEIVDFLKNPKKYIEIGARIPKGVLMVGPPGTGKTYLSRAVAGEAKVPFFSISGSDFVEMFVGVGASRVRDLFEQAKKNSPCIIFIDEIDAVGRRRGAGLGGGHDEREQTLNQLLVEMDGFGKNEGIIVMAATNRPDILDPAILRPGRFDRQIFIGLPDVREREAILEVHTKNKKLDPDVELKDIAKTTTGFTPADLENLCNEAALLAARNNLKTIPKWIFDEAAIKVVAGPEKKSAVVIEKERVLTAYHESGHAIVSRLLPDQDPVHMITIVPRGRAGGFTAYIPQEDRRYMTRNGMKHQLVALLGGRAAEAVVLDDISTGASNDIERATKIARAMVTKYGMSTKLGPIMYGSDEEEVFVGKDFGHMKNYSEEVAADIDSEIRQLIEQAYQTALRLLEENAGLLHQLAKLLLEKETIDANEFEELYTAYTKGEDINSAPPHELEEVKKIDETIEERLDMDEDKERGEG